MRFYSGCEPHQAHELEYAFISASRLWRRRKPFVAHNWIMDSGGYTEIANHGDYRHSPRDYVRLIERMVALTDGTLEAAVTQDYMCDPASLARTGQTIQTHQAWTIDRYDEIVSLSPPVYIMPVLQGGIAEDYVRHLEAYGDRIGKGAYVGVGSMVKRRPEAIRSILEAILKARPDLRLHGFGVKLRGLVDTVVRQALHSADSWAWSYAARREGRDANDIGEALKYAQKIAELEDGDQVTQPKLW